MAEPADPPRTQAEVLAWLIEFAERGEELAKEFGERPARAAAVARAVLVLLKEVEEHDEYQDDHWPPCPLCKARDEAVRILGPAMGER